MQTTVPSDTPPNSPEITALLTLVEATHLSSGHVHEALWLELEQSNLPVERLAPLALQDMQLGNAQTLRMAENPRTVCSKIRAVLRKMAARHSFRAHQALICRIPVLAHRSCGTVARPDLGLITELLDDCSACGRTLLGTLGELFTRAS